jgi:hypothetical protein
MRHASKLACTLCGLMFALIFATDVLAQPIVGMPCDPVVRFNNSACTRPTATCAPGGNSVCGACRRVSGTCAPGCLDSRTSAELTVFDPFNLCSAACTSQRGQCVPATCNSPSECRNSENCTEGFCQAKTCTRDSTCGAQAHCDRATGLCTVGAPATGPLVTTSPADSCTQSRFTIRKPGRKPQVARCTSNPQCGPGATCSNGRCFCL